MPLVKIEMLKGKSSEYKKALLDGVHQALVDTFKIPDYDRMQRLYELDKENNEPPLENWGVAGGKPASEVDFGFKIDV